MKRNKVLDCLLLAIIMISILFIAILPMKKENENLSKKLEFYENESIRESTIIGVTDCCVYVFDDFVNKFIEVDIFDELIHTTIEVGDTAIYVVDYYYTDADLIAIIKNND